MDVPYEDNTQDPSAPIRSALHPDGELLDVNPRGFASHRIDVIVQPLGLLVCVPADLPSATGVASSLMHLQFDVGVLLGIQRYAVGHGMNVCLSLSCCSIQRLLHLAHIK